MSSSPTLSEPELAPLFAPDPELLSDDEGSSDGGGVETVGPETVDEAPGVDCDPPELGVVPPVGPLDPERPPDDEEPEELPPDDEEPPEDDEPEELLPEDDEVLDVEDVVPVDALPDDPRRAFVACCSSSLDDGGGASFNVSLNSSPRRCLASAESG